MSALRLAAQDAARLGPAAVLPSERLFASERAAARLEGRRIEGAAPTARLLRDRLADLWKQPDPAKLIAQALAAERRSLDRALIHAYLAAMPSGHPAFEALRTAAETAAERHDWAWRERGRALRLWSPERDADGLWRLPADLAARLNG